MNTFDRDKFETKHEEELRELHAQQYAGLDDGMDDDYQEWLADMDDDYLMNLI